MIMLLQDVLAAQQMILMDDLRARLANRVQLTTDGHRAYLEAVEGAIIDLFGPERVIP